MCLIQMKHAQIKFPLFSFWTVWLNAQSSLEFIGELNAVPNK